MTVYQRAIFATLGFFAACTCARGENWPAWRGASGDGLSREPNLPRRWGPSESVLWKISLPGRGHSSPIIWEDSVFITSCIEEEQCRVLFRIDRRTGAVVWQRTTLVAPLEDIHSLNSFASSTAATDGRRVFVTFLDRTQMFVAAYDFDGNELWQQRPGEFHSKHGFCTSPVLYKDRLIVNGDHDGDAYIAMLRQADGKVVWKIPRENKTRSYCTPIIVSIDGRDQMMLNGSYCTAGYDVETGKRVWICDGPSEQMVATLVHGHGLVFSLGGYPERHLLAIRKGGSGDVTKSHVVWRTHKAIPYVPSPLLYGDWLHVASDEGFYTCFEPTTGVVKSNHRAAKHISSSLVGGDDHVYITDDTGATLVIRNGPGFDVVSRNAIGEECYSTPAISGGSIFIRGVRHLFRIGAPDSNAASGR